MEDQIKRRGKSGAREGIWGGKAKTKGNLRGSMVAQPHPVERVRVLKPAQQLERVPTKLSGLLQSLFFCL